MTTTIHERYPLICPDSGQSLSLDELSGELATESGNRYPIVNDILRTVPASNYADAFGHQWNLFRQTQLDSVTGVPVSRDRLTQLLGGSLDCLHDKNVLEVGCGAGRFTEVLLDAGATVTPGNTEPGRIHQRA